MSKGSKRRVGVGFEDNFDKIFGSKKEREKKWAEEEPVEVRKRSIRRTQEFKEFVSPIDRKVVSCNGGLRKHNKKHGVTNTRDYGDKWFDRKHIERSDRLTGNTERQRKDRVNAVKDSLQRHGVFKP